MLALVDQKLQIINHAHHLPFGGLNAICIGDLHQLPPIRDKWIFLQNNTLSHKFWLERIWCYELKVVKVTN